jgi:hypothetical protein
MGKIIYSLVLVKKDSGKFTKLLSSLKGILGANLSVVIFGEIMAVVSDIEETSTLADKSNLVEYAKLIETLAQQFTVLPVQYGSIMESSELVENMLKKNYSKFHENLEKVENKVEYGLKVFCDSKEIKKELASKLGLDVAPKSLQKDKTSIYKEYLNKKLKEHQLEKSLLEYVDTVIQDITAQLSKMNPTHKFKKMESESKIIDAVFLIKKSKQEDLITSVKDLQSKHIGLRLMLTGPWPPYNFVNITIN